jgi:hypothetical protein
MGLKKEIGWEDVDWNRLGHDKDKWGALSEHGTVPQNFVKDGTSSLDEQLLTFNKDSAPWSEWTL